MVTATDVAQALRILGVPLSTIRKVGSGDAESAFARLQALHPDIKKLYRARAFETHADRGGDPIEFQRVRQAWDVLQTPDAARHMWDAVQRERASTPAPEPEEAPSFTSGVRNATASTTGFGGFTEGVPQFARRKRWR